MKTVITDKKLLAKLAKAEASLGEFLRDNDIEDIRENYLGFRKAKRRKVTPSPEHKNGRKLHLRFERLTRKVENLRSNIVQEVSTNEVNEVDVVTPESNDVQREPVSHNDQECVSQNCGCSLQGNLFLPPGVQPSVPESLPPPVRLFDSEPVVDGEVEDIQVEEEDDDIYMCNNCHRRDVFRGDPVYDLDLLSVQICDVDTRYRKDLVFFYHVDEVVLCKCCRSLFQVDSRSNYHNSWPTFMWSFLNDEVNREKYGEKLWSIFPLQWRKWWLDSAIQFDELSEISLFQPDAVVKDVTSSVNNFLYLVGTGKLGDLAQACNDHMMPTVLCPWGCNEYLHKSEIFPIDMVLQRYFRKVQLRAICKAKDQKEFGIKCSLDHLVSARDDFFRDNISECDDLLLNPDWMVLPSIAIVEGSAFFLTCRNHKNGTLKQYVHVPRSPTSSILPAKLSDQICQTVLKTRTIKPLKKGKFSNTYQMHEQRGSFQGIDTCNVASIGNFNHNSQILRESELAFIGNRPDIVSLLSDLVKKKKMSELLKDSLIDLAQTNKLSEEKIASLLHGSTFIGLEDSMKMQELLCDVGKRKIRVTINREDGENRNSE